MDSLRNRVQGSKPSQAKPQAALWLQLVHWSTLSFEKQADMNVNENGKGTFSARVLGPGCPAMVARPAPGQSLSRSGWNISATSCQPCATSWSQSDTTGVTVGHTPPTAELRTEAELPESQQVSAKGQPLNLDVTGDHRMLVIRTSTSKRGRTASHGRHN